MNLDGLTLKIESWAEKRQLDNADPNKQMLKLMEEVGELAEGLAKGDVDLVADSIGDIYVVLTILSLQLGMNLPMCVKHSYNEIKDRKGKMVDGVYVKESDLK